MSVTEVTDTMMTADTILTDITDGTRRAACAETLCAERAARKTLRIGVILLIAGESRRMGTNKQLLPWQQGTILDAVCRALRDGVHMMRSDTEPVFVAVTGTRHESLAPVVNTYGFTALRNEKPEDGQGSSLRIGMEYILSLPEAQRPDGILCSVGDQPLLTKQAVCDICSEFIDSGDVRTIVVPHYGVSFSPGNPVLFGSFWYPSLCRIEGDEGGRAVIRGEGRDCVRQLWISDDIGADVDTPEDYKALQQRESEAL